jgi:hypothetical protein
VVLPPDAVAIVHAGGGHLDRERLRARTHCGAQHVGELVVAPGVHLVADVSSAERARPACRSRSRGSASSSRAASQTRLPRLLLRHADELVQLGALNRPSRAPRSWQISRLLLRGGRRVDLRARLVVADEQVSAPVPAAVSVFPFFFGTSSHDLAEAPRAVGALPTEHLAELPALPLAQDEPLPAPLALVVAAVLLDPLHREARPLGLVEVETASGDPACASSCSRSMRSYAEPLELADRPLGLTHRRLQRPPAASARRA